MSGQPSARMLRSLVAVRHRDVESEPSGERQAASDQRSAGPTSLSPPSIFLR